MPTAPFTPELFRFLTELRAHNERDWFQAKLGSGCGMIGESLKRPPPGFDANHPCIEDIKRKDFGLSVPLDDRRVAHPAFVNDVLDGFRATAPFLEFLTESIGLTF